MCTFHSPLISWNKYSSFWIISVNVYMIEKFIVKALTHPCEKDHRFTSTSHSQGMDRSLVAGAILSGLSRSTYCPQYLSTQQNQGGIEPAARRWVPTKLSTNPLPLLSKVSRVINLLRYIQLQFVLYNTLSNISK